MVAMLVLATAVPAEAQASAPGTVIDNTARIMFSAGGADRTVSSNTVRLIVAERLDVALTRAGAATVPAAPDTIVPLVLTNTGSGSEAFVLSAALDGGAALAMRFLVDRNGDGLLDAGDSDLASGRTDALAAGASLKLLAMVRQPPAGVSLTISAAAVTGSGAPGSAFAGAGDGGGDAVVGASGARASVSVAIDAAAAGATIVKSQAVRDRSGGTVAESGATITYTLEANFAIASPGAVISDPVPAGTTFKPGSVTLDGVALADAAAAAPAQGGAIRVDLGAVAAGASRVVTFQVIIQ